MCSIYFQKIRIKNPAVKDVAVQCPEHIRKMLSGYNQNEAWRVSQVIQVKMELVVYGYTFVFYFSCPKIIAVNVLLEKS